MGLLATKQNIIQQLQKEVLGLQGIRKLPGSEKEDMGLGPIENAFPNGIFPTGAVHEFLSTAREDAASTNGFISGLLGKLMKREGYCLWIGTKRTIFPPALKIFGIEPHHIIFVDLARQKDVLWTIEEALKCDTLAAVVGEFTDLSFKESRRLQLAVEQSRVTGLIHRYAPRIENTVACVTKWKIKPITSLLDNDLPGVGYPRWNVQLVKVRNGKPGTWQVEWAENSFRHIPRKTIQIPAIKTFKTGAYA